MLEQVFLSLVVWVFILIVTLCYDKLKENHKQAFCCYGISLDRWLTQTIALH